MNVGQNGVSWLSGLVNSTQALVVSAEELGPNPGHDTCVHE